MSNENETNETIRAREEYLLGKMKLYYDQKTKRIFLVSSDNPRFKDEIHIYPETGDV